jgi:DNA-directed RNA polymerase beta subunit
MEYGMDEYPQGTNAVVAVISYTGYDMEDAMIINKGAFQRGFGHGSVYKTAEIDLDVEEKRVTKHGTRPSLSFSNVKSVKRRAVYHAVADGGGGGGEGETETEVEKFDPSLDLDGLPMPGLDCLSFQGRLRSFLGRVVSPLSCPHFDSS